MKKNKKPIASLQKIDTTFESLLQDFPSNLIKSAKELAAFQRRRKIRKVEQLFQMVLLYCGLDYSLRETSGVLTLLGTDISDQGVSDRLRSCRAWLSEMLKAMLPSLPSELATKVVGRWLLIDGSTVQVAGARGTSYRIHLGWDWVSQTLVEMRITDAKIGESLKLYEIQAGDVVMADRGYARYNDVKYVLEKGGEVIIRYAPQLLSLVDEKGEKLKLADELWATDGQLMSRKVVMKKDASKQALYLHCFRLPAEKAAQIKRKKRAKAQSEGITIKKETLEYAEWTLILTSLPPAQVSAEEIGKMYRLRWQIEIVIKRLKSCLKLDNLRSQLGSQLSEVYLLGKSLYALMIERRAGRLKNTQAIEWRVWKMIAEQVRPLINQVKNWQAEYVEPAIKQLRERKRRRKRQSNIANELINYLFSHT